MGRLKEKGIEEEEEGEKEVQKRRPSIYWGTDTARYYIKCLVSHLILTETLECKSYYYPRFTMRWHPGKSKLYAPDHKANKQWSETRSPWFWTYAYIYGLSYNVWCEKFILKWPQEKCLLSSNECGCFPLSDSENYTTDCISFTITTQELRTKFEAQSQPLRWPSGLEYLSVNIFVVRHRSFYG